MELSDEGCLTRGYIRFTPERRAGLAVGRRNPWQVRGHTPENMGASGLDTALLALLVEGVTLELPDVPVRPTKQKGSFHLRVGPGH